MLNVSLSEEKYVQGTESLLPAVTYIAYIFGMLFFSKMGKKSWGLSVLKFPIEVHI